MPASDAPVAVHSLTDDELEQWRRAVLKEQALRRRLDASPEKIEAVISEYQRSIGRKDGDPWEPPGSVLDSYPQGAVVAFEGKHRKSKRRTNMIRPDDPEAWDEAGDNEGGDEDAT